MFLLLVSVHLAAAADGRSILLVGIERLRFDAMRLRSRRGRYPRVQPIQVVQRMRPRPDRMSNALTAISNWRSERRRKMRNPNHAPNKAAGTNASVFQSNCAALAEAGRIR